MREQSCVSILDDALVVRAEIQDSGLDIYASLEDHLELVYTREELAVLLIRELTGHVFAGPIRTRSKLAKEAVCEALGYQPPASFRRTKPRFPGQDLDIYVQQHDNLQVWNEELSPTRRYALLRVDNTGRCIAIRVVEGQTLVELDRTGTLTSKYQAKRREGRTGSKLVSASDTKSFTAELGPVASLSPSRLRDQEPVSAPVHGQVLTVQALYERLLSLIGQEMEYSPSERLRGERLHRLVCEVLGLGSYADTGKFPDIVSQALEVKLQTSPTIDLGLITPNSEGAAVSLSPRLRHCDVRYLVAYATHDGELLTVEGVVVSTGNDFFDEFQRYGGLVQNRKLQLGLPRDFFS